MGKFLAIGTLLVVVFAVVFAPAGLSRLALDQVEAVTLQDPSGTLWAGNGRLSVNGTDLGTLGWDLQAVTILSGALGYDFTLVGQDLDLQGTARAGWDQTYAATATGRVGEAFINQLMAPYDMAISGDLNLNACRVEMAGQIPQSAAGNATWEGGQVQYILSGRRSSNRLPAMVAELGAGPEAVVREVDGEIPLIIAELQADGFAKVGLTKHLTTLLNNPWPGPATAAEVVLQVEEKVF